MLLLWLICGVLISFVIMLAVKVTVMQKSLKEICDCIQEQLFTDTNKLIWVSSNDKQIRHLAKELNKHLSELRRLRRQYENGNRELKDAVTNISHDLRTPLTAICGYLDLLELESKSEDAERYLDYISERTEAMKNLTEELFCYSVTISTKDDLSVEKVCINDILENSIASFYYPLTERGIAPALNITKNRIFRLLNKDALSRVFGNILTNAVKYSGGDLEVTLFDDGKIVFTNTAEDLDEVQVGKLFDRFYTVEAARRSTGLGLAIAKTLVEQMNGKIEAAFIDKKLSIILFFSENI